MALCSGGALSTVDDWSWAQLERVSWPETTLVSLRIELRRKKMPIQTLDAKVQELLRGRHIATLATENADGSMHLTAVWYLFVARMEVNTTARLSCAEANG